VSIRQSAQKIEQSCIPIIVESKITTEADAAVLLKFRSMVVSMMDASKSMAASASDADMSIRINLMGTSRDMNRAAASLSTSTGELVTEVNIFIERLKRVDEACERKITTHLGSHLIAQSPS
jgi:hypothetical protein